MPEIASSPGRVHRPDAIVRVKAGDALPTSGAPKGRRAKTDAPKGEDQATGTEPVDTTKEP